MLSNHKAHKSQRGSKVKHHVSVNIIFNLPNSYYAEKIISFSPVVLTFHICSILLQYLKISMCIFMLCFSFPLENWWINQLHFGSACFHFLTKPQGFLAVRNKWPHSLLPAFFCRVLIGSPLTGQPAKRTGDVYRCPVGQNKNTGCEKFLLPGERWPYISICVFG